ncbi:hypothetical protein BTL50_00475 [Bordetella holmesii]|nr:hypothetical protein H558_06710 [Bordetella holmesii H558]AOB34102.1 hypothetical protein BBB42_00470 [Bordetella holmesii]AUL18123.1 hypothetical protein BTL46_00475 [Bordetella holmesii]AUL21435.1 hypothetical protein BTL48_00475 [Bordetella holmesii]AUL24758.1 hypothetical protein BTL49_00475 [Bordetella holmesii]
MRGRIVGQFDDRRIRIGRVDAQAGRHARRLGIGGHSRRARSLRGHALLTQPAQPACRPHRLGHEQRGQGQGGPDPRLELHQPFTGQAQRHTNHAGRQHGQNDEIAPGSLIEVAQPQRDGHPG